MTFTNGVHKTINYRDCISFGLFVHNKGTIQNLQVTANIDLTSITNNYSLPQDREIVVGVVAAINEGLIHNYKVSASSGSFMINSTIHVKTITGGIAGYNDNNGRITSCTNNGTITYANSSSSSQLIQPNMGHIAGKNSSGSVLNGSLNFSSGTVNIGTLQIVGSHNQALYAGNRALGRGYIFNGNAIISVP